MTGQTATLAASSSTNQNLVLYFNQFSATCNLSLRVVDETVVFVLCLALWQGIFVLLVHGEWLTALLCYFAGMDIVDFVLESAKTGHPG